MGPDELFQRAVIARRYYLEGRTRIQIAEEFGLSRFKVARMLDEALESGMVEIKIHNPGAIDVELSTALQRQYGLEHAYAVSADSTNAADHVDAVAKAMAELLQSILRDGDVVGVDCGRTLTHIAPYLTSLPRCDVVQLTGMAGPITSNGTDLVRRISEVSGGESWPLYAPLVVTDARTARSLGDNPQIRETDRPPRHRSAAPSSRSARGAAGASQVYESLTADETSDPRRRQACAPKPARCCWTPTASGSPASTSAGWASTRRCCARSPPGSPSRRARRRPPPPRPSCKSGLVSSLVTDIDIATAVLD